jgi:hypothetical protein
MTTDRLLRSRTARAVAGTALLALVAGVGLGLQQGRPGAAGGGGHGGVGVGPDPSVPIHQAWVPPGTYTAMVFSTNAKDRRWIVTLRTAEGSYPVAVPPGETVVLPFAGGWQILPTESVRIESQYAPFEDPTRRNLMDGNENLTVSAWGIGPNGPVTFRPPAKPRPAGP